MPDQPLEELLRRIIREESQNAAQQHAGPTLSQVREIIREEVKAVEERLGSLEKRVTDGFSRMDEQFAWTEEQFEWVGQRFDAVDQRFAELKKAIEGVIDEKFPPIDQQQSGGPASPVAIAAKGGR